MTYHHVLYIGTMFKVIENFKPLDSRLRCSRYKAAHLVIAAYSTIDKTEVICDSSNPHNIIKISLGSSCHQLTTLTSRVYNLVPDIKCLRTM